MMERHTNWSTQLHEIAERISKRLHGAEGAIDDINTMIYSIADEIALEPLKKFFEAQDNVTEKPWGSETILYEFGAWRLKLIVVDAGHQMRVQYHDGKTKYWFFRDGTIQWISLKMQYQLDGSAVVLEVANESDDDIVYLRDDYGRAP